MSRTAGITATSTPPDAEGAKSFYGSVFGWETLALEGGLEMCVGGYGDFLERSDPGLRRRMAESGAPEGFEDVVATLNPIADDQPDVPPHWGVTFAVDDADATAERAAELGGEVVVPPFDGPWVRMTVLTHPQGAKSRQASSCPRTRISAVRRTRQSTSLNKGRRIPEPPLGVLPHRSQRRFSRPRPG
jgi:predicted enzyme related to lactoylglutathione lyase